MAATLSTNVLAKLRNDPEYTDPITLQVQHDTYILAYE